MLLIGYGSPLRSDDALGGLIAEALGGLSLLQLSPELAEPISRADFVVFIDACYGEDAGKITCETIQPQSNPNLTHSSNPSTLLDAARTFYGYTPPALLISIIGASFDYGDSLSPQLQDLLPTLIEQVQAIISSHRYTH